MAESEKCRHGNDPSTCQHCASDGLDWLRKALGGNNGDDNKCSHGNDPSTCEQCKNSS